MKKTLSLLALTVSALALTACLDSSSNSSTPIVTGPVAPYKPVPVTGSYQDNAAHAVFSTDDGEGPINTRFSVQFTANEEVVIADSVLNKTYTFDAGHVRGDSFNLMEELKLYATQLDTTEDLGGEPDWNDQVAVDAFFDALEAVYVLTPTNTNSNDYALARVSTKDGQQWMLIGDPTSTVLAGQATYSGGYYTAGDHAAIGTMNMSADFSQAANAIDVTLHKPVYDNANAVFGANSIGFSADFNSATNTIEAAGKAVNGGGHFDTVDVHGAFFKGGDAAAGLLRLQGAGVSDSYGAFHAIKD